MPFLFSILLIGNVSVDSTSFPIIKFSKFTLCDSIDGLFIQNLSFSSFCFFYYLLCAEIAPDVCICNMIQWKLL